MQIFLSNTLLLTKRLLALMLVYSFSRFYFLAYNIDSFSPIEWNEIVKAAFFGLRFDFSSILFINAVFIIIHFIPGRFNENTRYQSITKGIMIVVNMIFLMLNIIDTGYFKFQNTRSGADFISNMLFSNDTVNLMPSYIKDYWFHAVAWIAVFWLMIKYFPRYKPYSLSRKFKPAVALLVGSGVAILYIGTSFTIYRGFGIKPLQVVDSQRYTSARYAPLMLNSSFTVLKTIGKESMPIYSFFIPEDSEKFYTSKQLYTSNKPFVKKNVVVIILESFSKKLIGAINNEWVTYTPFLDSIINEGYVFENAFANGNKSVVAIPSVLISTPSFMNMSLISSKYAINNFNGINSILKEEGYNTAFFHGAYNGSLGFDKFCMANDIDHYFGMTEYNEAFPNNHDYDKNWGIFDDVFLQYTAHQIDNIQQPFVSSIFTISSHHPYDLPEQFKTVFHEKYKELNAVRYADYSLQKFFETARKSAWYNNTLFVLVADHTALYANDIFSKDTTVEIHNASRLQQPIDNNRIPIVFFDPSNKNLKGRSTRICQQLDIMPSVLHYLNYQKCFISFGSSLFDSNAKQFALYYNNNVFTYIDSTTVLNFDGTEILNAYDYHTNQLVSVSDSSESVKTLKAFLQDFSNRLVYNKLRCNDIP